VKDSITKKAYGKINLSLDVLGRREDGYHLVKMVMQTVGIYDTLTIERAEEEEITLSTDSGVIPGGPDNLVWRAAKVCRREFGIRDGLCIHLEKRIPIAAGMAGGSTDAAAVFTGLRDLYAPEITNGRLRELALPLGADIPYCITGGTQLSEGIGEILTRLPAAPSNDLIVVKPDLYVSTGWVYGAYDSIPEAEVIHPDVDAQVQAIRDGDLYAMAAACGNVLEQKTGTEYPVIGELEQFLTEHGAVRAIMTGSGPAVFAIFDDHGKAETAFAALQSAKKYESCQKFLTGFVNP
jgi:4-diphosphocytidyl-2-C-methyl-D-erythritol kinase